MDKFVRIACNTKDYLPLDELQPLQGDLKSLSKESYNQLKNEILSTGFAFPCFVWKDGDGLHRLISGHQRVRTLNQMRDDGYVIPNVPVVFIEAENVKAAKRRVLQDVAQYGKVEGQGLYEFSIGAEIEPLDLIGSFRLPDIDPNSFIKEFFEDNTVPAYEGDPDEVGDLPREPKSKLGDVWTLGKHRLMCGDSTSIDAVEKLMDREKADMVFTDPPYGMNFQSNFREKTPQFERLKNDDVILEIGGVIWAVMANNSVAYICCRWDLYDKWLMQFNDSFDVKNLVVWHKPGGGMGDLKNAYTPNHEFIIVAHKGASALRGKREADVWTIGKDGANQYQHPTQKPVALSEFAIINHSDDNQNILDLFGGSGSTLIACEKTGRKCFMMELDPRYVDVILARFAKFTGIDPIRDDGTKWSDLLASS